MTTLKYFISGITSYLLYLGLLISSIEIFNFEILYSSIITYLIALIFNFVILKIWVFNSKGQYKSQFLKYNIISCLGYLLNSVGFYLLATLLEIHYMIIQGILFMLISTLNYFLNTLWTFNFNKKIK